MRRATLKRYFVRPAKYFLRKLNLYRKSSLNSTISKKTKKECATPTSVTRASSSVQASLKPAVKA